MNLSSLLLITLTTVLGQFDQKQEVATANQFFQMLDKEGFTEERIQFKNDTPVDSLRQQVWYWAAEWLYDRQQYEQAVQYGKKALPLFRYDNDDRAGCLNILGCIYVRMGDVKQAADYAKQCLAIDMKSGDDDRISSSMNTVAGIYMAGYQAKEAEQYILQALEHADKAKNPARQAVILGMASEIYHTLGNDQKALPYAEQAYRIDSTLNRQPQATIRQSQCASALLGLHRYQEAERILRKVVPALREIGDTHAYAIALNRLGMSLLCQKREREAIPYYKEAAGLFSKMGDLYNEIHSHRGLYESYWTVNPDSAKIELDYFDLLKDSLYTHATADALSRYNAEFGNDQLQQENEEARLKHHYLIGAIIVILLLCAVAAWYTVRQMRLRQQQTQELIKEIERLKNEMMERKAETETETAPVSAVPDEDRLFLMRVIEVVNEGMAKGQLNVEHIASELNMSVQTFRRRLQSTAGETPKAFISAIQMEKAVKLLKESPDIPVLEVASRCGFEESSSFTHTFKRVYGVSPKEFRYNVKM